MNAYEQRQEDRRERLRNAADKRRAEDLDRRADSVGTGGISSDDPDAIAKIKQRVASLEDAQRQMSEFNAGWRKAGRPSPDDQEGWKRVADILGRSDNDLHEIRASMARGRTFGQGNQPFEAYALSNNNANIRRLKSRLATLERRAEMAAEM